MPAPLMPSLAAVGSALVAVGGLERTTLPVDADHDDATWDDAVTSYVVELARVLRRGSASRRRVRGLMCPTARPILPCVVRCAHQGGAPIMFLPRQDDGPADVARALDIGDADLAIVVGLGVGADGGIGHYLPIYVDTRRRILHTADPYAAAAAADHDATPPHLDALGAWARQVLAACAGADASPGSRAAVAVMRVRVGRGVRQDAAALTCGPWTAWLLTAWALDVADVRREVGAPLFGDDRGVLRFWRAVTRLAAE